MKTKALKSEPLSSQKINDRNRRYIVNLVEKGRLTIDEAVKKYSIRNRTVLIEWIRIYGTFDVDYIVVAKMDKLPQDKEEIKRLRELLAAKDEEIKRLKRDAEDNRQRKILIDAIIQVAKEDHNIDLSKKVIPELSTRLFGAKRVEE